MNKRQIKKRDKIIRQRLEFFNQHIISSGRRNGKTSFVRAIYKACMSKKYKYFKALKKTYKKIFIAVDFSNGRDFSVKTTYKISSGVAKVLKNEVIN